MSLIVNNLSKRYGNTWALRDVSFEVEGGSVIGLFGGTGSGKTTLLKAIAGQLKTNGGSTVFDGSDLSAIKAKERPITYIGEGSGGALKTIFNTLRPSGSTGQMSLSAFESSLSDAGRVILLDDIFGHVDRSLVSDAFRAIRRLGKMKGKVIIFASSDFQQILEVCDEVAVLSDGEIIQTGSPQGIYDDPESVEAAKLTGENNLIEARRISSSDVGIPEFHTIDGGHRLFAENTDKSRLGPINQNMTLAIRPEQIVVTPGTSHPEDNLIPAKVSAIRPLGPLTLIEFDAGGLRLTAWYLKPSGLRGGSDCMIGLPPHRIRILKR